MYQPCTALPRNNAASTARFGAVKIARFCKKCWCIELHLRGVASLEGYLNIIKIAASLYLINIMNKMWIIILKKGFAYFRNYIKFVP